MPDKKYVYLFADGVAEDRDEWRSLLGGKGAGLAEMTALGIRVPPGFTLSTEAGLAYYALGNRYPDGLWDEVLTALGSVERSLGATFGDPNNPLLLSVRSGARESMPGMMDTVLNIGLNDQTVEGLAVAAGDLRFAYDSYRRFVTMFSNVVMGVPYEVLEALLSEAKAQHQAAGDSALHPEALRDLIAVMKARVQDITGRAFPPQALGSVAPQHQCRVRLLAQRSCGGIPAPARHSP